MATTPSRFRTLTPFDDLLPPPLKDDRVSLNATLVTLAAHYRPILLATIFSGLIGYGLVQLVDKTYEARSTVFVTSPTFSTALTPQPFSIEAYERLAQSDYIQNRVAQELRQQEAARRGGRAGGVVDAVVSEPRAAEAVSAARRSGGAIAHAGAGPGRRQRLGGRVPDGADQAGGARQVQLGRFHPRGVSESLGAGADRPADGEAGGNASRSRIHPGADRGGRRVEEEPARLARARGGSSRGGAARHPTRREAGPGRDREAGSRAQGDPAGADAHQGALGRGAVERGRSRRRDEDRCRRPGDGEAPDSNRGNQPRLRVAVAAAVRGPQHDRRARRA